MDELTLAGRPPITVAVRRNGRARRLTLRISRLDGRVTLTIPPHVSSRAARDFAQAKEGWLRGQIGEAGSPVAVACGTILPVEGEAKRVRLGPEEVAAPGEIAAASAGALLAALRLRARDRLAAAVDRHGAALGRPAKAIRVADPRSRWGSCSADGRLMFSWRLVLAPPQVLDYVAAHEVAHLAQMNHSPAFWAEVAALCPGYETHRAWLRREGLDLHRWQFGH